MLVSPIVLDASMTAAEVLRRLAKNGLWLDPSEPEAAAWIKESAAPVDIPPSVAARQLAQPVTHAMAAIRRQWFANVLWYIRPIGFVLDRCQSVPPGTTLLDALNLHEPDSRLPIALPQPGRMPAGDGLVLAGDTPVAVSVNLPHAAPPRREESIPPVSPVPPPRPAPVPGGAGIGTTTGTVQPPVASPPWVGVDLGATRGGGGGPSSAPPEQVVQTWPWLDAPKYMPARTEFRIVVGFARERQPEVTGGQVTLRAPQGVDQVQLTVELTAEGVHAPEGWTRPMPTRLADPASASVSFKLIGLDPPGPEPVHLTMLEIRFLLENGEVCGTASKPLVIGQAGQSAPPVRNEGTAWLAQPPTASAVDLTADVDPPDLTIELMKPDGNVARGNFVCRLRSPHKLKAGRGPFPIDFGEDAKSFARTIVDRIRLYGATALVDNYVRSFGGAVADKLPQAAHDALREVAAITAPRPPAVLFISAEPYVPWELAYIDPPLDPKRPPYLGAQVVLGRWLRDKPIDDTSPSALAPLPGGAARVEKPPVAPPREIPVQHMAVVAGIYPATSGFRSLPEAKVEATDLTAIYQAIPLAASAQSISQLLDAKLEQNFVPVGGADAVHFAGHGEFDPNRPDASVLFLSDGMPLSSDLFRGARYGGAQQPLIFLNACMIGIGGEMLGDMGGFPGNCLKGGFGGVLGALWEVNDLLARHIAMEFWKRVLPPAGGTGEPIAEVLRDIRAAYALAAPFVPTYLAYVYYGHPRLKLRRIP